MALRTPLFDWHQARGGTLVEFGGWTLPVRYSTITDEHQTVRSAAGLFDISHMGRLSFTGPDALALLQFVYTNNAATMKEGQVRYGLICNSEGGIRDDVLLYRWPDSWSLVVNASNRAKIVEHLQPLLAGRNVSMQDQTETTCMVAVQGPRALSLSVGLFDLEISTLKYYFAAPAHYKGTPCILSRTGYTGEDGFEVILPAALGPTLADELLQRGAKPCGLGARDTLRLEAAMPLYGHELTEETDPLQAGLQWAVKLDKGDFLGRDAILRRQQDTSRPVRVGLVLEGRRAAREGAAVQQGEQAIGRVTSGTITPTVGKAIAMAYVAPTCAAPATQLQVAVGSATTAAEVVALPFYRRP